jgi:DNA invertase Pin-like site-specific DNA recombinase
LSSAACSSRADRKDRDGSAAGKLQFHVFAALAEFERGLIRERTRAGLEAARARGRSGGHKPKLDAKQIRHIKALLRDPNTCVAELARDYGVSRTTIYSIAAWCSRAALRGHNNMPKAKTAAPSGVERIQRPEPLTCAARRF